MDCFGTYFTHVQTCTVTRVQSATEWTASVHTLHMHVQTCTVTCVQSATESTASVHTLHMSKPVMYPVFKMLRNVYWALGSPYGGGLRGGTLTEGFQVPCGGGFRGGILRTASRYF